MRCKTLALCTVTCVNQMATRRKNFNSEYLFFFFVCYFALTNDNMRVEKKKRKRKMKMRNQRNGVDWL